SQHRLHAFDEERVVVADENAGLVHGHTRIEKKAQKAQGALMIKRPARSRICCPARAWIPRRRDHPSTLQLFGRTADPTQFRETLAPSKAVQKAGKSAADSPGRYRCRCH